MKRNIGIILANGKGIRAGKDIPKQFIEIVGKSVLEHSITAFQNNKFIDEIVIVTNPDYFPLVEESIRKFGYTKIKHIIPGGAERYLSTMAALELFPEEECNVLIHDAVRPLVSQRIINDVIEALVTCNAVNVAIPVSDTIIQADLQNQCIEKIPDRNHLFQAQTPQGFNNRILLKSIQLYQKNPDFSPTDDCSLIHRYLPEECIQIVPGERSNIKITWPEDIERVQEILRSREPGARSQSK